VFDSVQVSQDHRPGPGPDRILVAELTGTARHHARWRELAQDEQDAAVTELRELADGRADLLAEVAGMFEGASDGELDEPLARQAAQLCRLAGADETLIPHWIAEGRRRAGVARMRPHSGQPRSPTYRHRPSGAACPPARTGAGGAAIEGQGAESYRWKAPACWR
jgi:hypothetical protein